MSRSVASKSLRARERNQHSFVPILKTKARKCGDHHRPGLEVCRCHNHCKMLPHIPPRLRHDCCRRGCLSRGTSRIGKIPVQVRHGGFLLRDLGLLQGAGIGVLSVAELGDGFGGQAYEGVRVGQVADVGIEFLVRPGRVRNVAMPLAGDRVWYTCPFTKVPGKSETFVSVSARVQLQALQLLNGAVLDNSKKRVFAGSDERNVSCFC